MRTKVEDSMSSGGEFEQESPAFVGTKALMQPALEWPETMVCCFH